MSSDKNVKKFEVIAIDDSKEKKLSDKEIDMKQILLTEGE